ncbi:hypothetical protein ACQKM2_39015 [Streptomyces sp. NPDC004126]|uniref:hypothetical protein n=1 Tax=Streptomyces sp. NPDC004126 TaxID=3390695 RepID=UPI003D041E91
MIQYHLVLDTPTLLALSGNRQVSALIHRAYLDADTCLWVPTLSILEAELQRAGTAEHIGQLDVIHTVDLDYPAALAVGRLCGAGVPPGVAAAVHAAGHLPDWGVGALVATVEAKAYDGLGVGVFDLSR